MTSEETIYRVETMLRDIINSGDTLRGEELKSVQRCFSMLLKIVENTTVKNLSDIIKLTNVTIN